MSDESEIVEIGGSLNRIPKRWAPAITISSEEAPAKRPVPREPASPIEPAVKSAAKKADWDSYFKW